jgi:hypothetical protein
MAKTIVTFNEVIEINHLLEENNLRFKVHLHDACGSQSFTVEVLSDCACEGRYEEMKQMITQYFMKKGVSVRFLNSNLEFVISD